jgi:predicted amidohydrolase YtcJ
MSELAFINGKIISMDQNNNIYEAVAVKDNKIIELGKSEEVLRTLSNPIIYDLKGKTLLPGFFESHMHLVETSRSLVELDLKNVKTSSDFVDVLYGFASGKKIGEWILGSGWSEADVFDGVMPTRHDIDRIVGDKPVCLVRQDGHSVVINTRAIEVLRLNDIKLQMEREVAPLQEDGSFTGLFYEEWVFKLLGMILDSLPKRYLEMALERGNHELVSNGVTSINDIMTQYPKVYSLYKEMQDRGKLNVRICAGPLGNSKEYEEFASLPEYDKLSKGPVKYFMDGSFGSRTALLFDGYEDEPQNRGMKVLSQEQLRVIFEDSLKNNIQIAIHAIGDRAVSIILDVYEEAFKKHPNKELRNRIEHVQIVRDEDIQRFNKLGLIASFQPIFCLEVDLNVRRLGMRRIKDTYRFKSFMESGVKVLFNSDCPFGGEYMKKKDGTYFKGFEPLLGIYCSVNDINLNKAEIVSVQSALECYTKNPAYANHREKELGTIEIGKLADLIVLEESPYEVEVTTIKDIKVSMTIVDGKIVYTRE